MPEDDFPTPIGKTRQEIFNSSLLQIEEKESKHEKKHKKPQEKKIHKSWRYASQTEYSINSTNLGVCLEQNRLFDMRSAISHSYVQRVNTSFETTFDISEKETFSFKGYSAITEHLRSAHVQSIHYRRKLANRLTLDVCSFYTPSETLLAKTYEKFGIGVGALYSIIPQLSIGASGMIDGNLSLDNSSLYVLAKPHNRVHLAVKMNYNKLPQFFLNLKPRQLSGTKEEQISKVHHILNSLELSFETKEDKSYQAVAGVTAPVSDKWNVCVAVNAGKEQTQLSVMPFYNIYGNTEIGFGMGVGTKSVDYQLVLKHKNHSFCLPVHVLDKFSAKVAALSVIIPAGLFVIGKLLYYPLSRIAAKKENKEKRSKQYQTLSEARNSQKIELEEMGNDIERSLLQEAMVDGLIILSARYGNLTSDAATEDEEHLPFIIVTNQLQFYVKSSKLHLPPFSKSILRGFYDPCPEDKKQLFVCYKYKGVVNQVQINDEEELMLPLSTQS